MLMGPCIHPLRDCGLELQSSGQLDVSIGSFRCHGGSDRGGRWSIHKGDFGLLVGLSPMQSSTRSNDPRWYFVLAIEACRCRF